MSLTNLSTETMVTISARWLDPKKQRKPLSALPLLAQFLPIIQEVHEALLSKQKTSSTIIGEIGKIQKEEAERDKRHDRKLRGTIGVLTGFAELADDPDEATALLDLRDRLAPIGNKATLRSYVDEAGDAQRLPSRLDTAANKLLSKLPTPGGPLEIHVTAWTDEAKQLGVLEERRDQLAQQLTAGEGGPTAAEVLAARNAWIRVARAMETNLRLERKADEETIEKILGPLRRAEAKADRRRGTAAKDEPEEVDEIDETDAVEPGKPAEPVATAPNPA